MKKFIWYLLAHGGISFTCDDAIEKFSLFLKFVVSCRKRIDGKYRISTDLKNFWHEVDGRTMQLRTGRIDGEIFAKNVFAGLV